MEYIFIKNQSEMFIMEGKNIQKRKKPKFKRQGVSIKKALKDSWRRPKGHQSKMRRREAGHGALPSKGYMNPKKIRGTIDGQKYTYIENLNDIKSVPDNSLVIVSSNIGVKKMIEIFKIAKEKKIKIYNKSKLKKMYKRIKELNAKKGKEKKENKKENSKENSSNESSESKKIQGGESKDENSEKVKKE